MKTKYTCPQCGNTITLHVNITQPPTCYNPNKHSGKRINMNVTRQEEREINPRRATKPS